MPGSSLARGCSVILRVTCTGSAGTRSARTYPSLSSATAAPSSARSSTSPQARSELGATDRAAADTPPDRGQAPQRFRVRQSRPAPVRRVRDWGHLVPIRCGWLRWWWCPLCPRTRHAIHDTHAMAAQGVDSTISTRRDYIDSEDPIIRSASCATIRACRRLRKTARYQHSSP